MKIAHVHCNFNLYLIKESDVTIPESIKEVALGFVPKAFLVKKIKVRSVEIEQAAGNVDYMKINGGGKNGELTFIADLDVIMKNGSQIPSEIPNQGIVFGDESVAKETAARLNNIHISKLTSVAASLGEMAASIKTINEEN